MKIIGAGWTAKINQLVIFCSCGYNFNHRADRWEVHCNVCGARSRLRKLRQEYFEIKEVGVLE